MALWFRILIAFVVFCHGFIYVRIGPIFDEKVKGWTGTSWLLGDRVTGDRLKALVVALHVIAGITTLGCAVAIGFAPSLPGWWRPLAIGGAVVGFAAFAALWDGQVRLLFEEGFIGALVSLALLVAALAFPLAFN